MDRILLLLALTLPVLACSTLVGHEARYEVRSRLQRGPYLDARLVLREPTREGWFGEVEETLRDAPPLLRLFFPASDVCERVLRTERIVQVESYAPFGRVEREGEACEPVGIGRLATWRDRRSRPKGPPVPREPADFREVYADEQVFFVRGRFPLAGLLGFAGGHDAIAVLPNNAACRPLVARGSASLEYRPAGREALVLVAEPDLCPVLGLPRPLD